MLLYNFILQEVPDACIRRIGKHVRIVRDLVTVIRELAAHNHWETGKGAAAFDRSAGRPAFLQREDESPMPQGLGEAQI